MCSHYSTTFDVFCDLSLPIPKRSTAGGVSLKECLDLFSQEEKLDKENAPVSVSELTWVVGDARKDTFRGREWKIVSGGTLTISEAGPTSSRCFAETLQTAGHPSVICMFVGVCTFVCVCVFVCMKLCLFTYKTSISRFNIICVYMCVCVCVCPYVRDV